MTRSIEYPCVRPYSAGLAAAGVGIVALGVLTAPPIPAVTAVPVESHLMQLTGAAAAEAGTSVVRIVSAFAAATAPSSPATPPPRLAAVPASPAAASRTTIRPAAADSSSTPPDLLSLAASFIDYLNSLGLGPLPSLLAIGVGGIVVTLGAVAYAWNGFAGLINPVLDFLHIPKVPTVPVCFFGQNCGAAAPAQARPAAAAATISSSGDDAVDVARPSVGRSNRAGVAVKTPAVVGSGRSAVVVPTVRTPVNPSPATVVTPPDGASAHDTPRAVVRSAAKSSASAATGSSKRVKTTSTD